MKRAALRENKLLAPLKHDILFIPIDICYIRWSIWIVLSKFDGAQLPRGLVTRPGICVKTKMNASFTALHTFCYHVLLLTTAYSHSTVHFFLGQFPNMELMLLLLSPLFLIELVIFSVNITLLLTGSVCGLKCMSQLDHLILEYTPFMSQQFLQYCKSGNFRAFRGKMVRSENKTARILCVCVCKFVVREIKNTQNSSF